jgi:alpha-tubulin suppressor-like RCC1 family protein
MSLRTRASLLAAGALGVAVALFACTAVDRGEPAAETPEASTGHDASPPDAADAAPPVDANDEFTVPDGAVVCSTMPCAVALSGGGSSFCALLQGGAVACWGENDQGQLGFDSAGTFPPASVTPRIVAGLTGVTSVSVGDKNTCATVTDGGVSCWGAPELVGAGITPKDGGPTYDMPVVQPTREDAVPAATSVAVGSHVGCVTTASGALSCWGHNESLELGRGPTASPYEPPANVALGTQTVAVARPGFTRTFAITGAGTVWSWGTSTQQGSYGFLLGRDTSEDPDAIPAPIPLLSGVRGLASGPTHACVVAGRLVQCWGSNENGQLGRGSFGQLFFLPGASNLAFVTAADDEDAGHPGTDDIPLQVAVGDGHSCAVMGSGRVYCWGANASGQLGTGISATATNSGVPQRILGLSGPAVGIASSSASLCALLRTGAVECWGPNYLGQLGSGTIDDKTHPQPAVVPFPR